MYKYKPLQISRIVFTKQNKDSSDDYILLSRILVVKLQFSMKLHTD